MALKQQFLDGLLYIKDGLLAARWNFPLAVGSNKDNPSGLGKGVNLSYSFLSSPPTEYPWGQNFRGFNSENKIGAQQALALITGVGNISFKAEARPSAGSIRFGFNAQSSGQAGFAYSPSYGYTFDSEGTILSISELPRGGDVWLNANVKYVSGDFKPGASGFGSLIHELGHAIGLKHPFEGKQQLSPDLDNNQYTVMSYTPHPKSKIVKFSQEKTSVGTRTSWTITDLDPRTLMLADIAAIQHLYGANSKTNAGPTSYRYLDGDMFLETIWDGGGTDTIDCSAMQQRCIISLVPGSFSSIGLRDTLESLRALHKVPDQVPSSSLDPKLYDGTNNLAIAFGCTIEHAAGSQANDSITGNALANTLRGGLGSDLLSGGGGSDRFRYATVNDSPAGTDQRDVIRDFNGAQGDRIDLATIDADPAAAGQQAFRYIGSADFSGQPGEVRFAQGLLQANLTADSDADLEIALAGVQAFSRTFLII